MSVASVLNIVIVAAALLTGGCGGAASGNDSSSKRKEATMPAVSTTSMILKSEAFKEGGQIPAKYGCDGQDISPPLEWNGLPADAKSLVLIVEDPDAPMGIWTHWVIFNIPPSAHGLPEGVPAKESLPDGALQGKNDFRNFGYGGPCPPGGTHRYFFRLYALNTTLNLPAGCSRVTLLKTMEHHVIAQAQLMGRYSRWPERKPV